MKDVKKLSVEICEAVKIGLPDNDNVEAIAKIIRDFLRDEEIVEKDKGYPVHRVLTEDAIKNEAFIYGYLLEMDPAATRSHAVCFALEVQANSIKTSEIVNSKLAEIANKNGN